MTEEIDYKGVVEQFQLENEKLREALKEAYMSRLIAHKLDFEWFTNLSLQERMYVIGSVCIALITVAYFFSLFMETRKA